MKFQKLPNREIDLFNILTELIDGGQTCHPYNIVIKIRSWAISWALLTARLFGHAILTIISRGHASPSRWLGGCLRDGNELQLSRRYDRSYPVPRPYSLLHLNEAHSASRRFLVCVKRSHLPVESFFESPTWDWIFHVMFDRFQSQYWW